MSRAIFIIILLFSNQVFNSSRADADTITFVADQWCPYNCEPDSDAPGFLVEIAKYALQKEGHIVDYSLMPWSRAIEESRAGRYSGIVGALKEDAPDFVFSRFALGETRDEFYVKAGNTWRYNGISSLEKLSLGVVKDYTYTEEMDAYIAANRRFIEKVQIAVGDNALDLNVKKLMAGRLDVLLEDKAVVDYYIRTNKLEDGVESAGTLGREPIYIAFSPANKNSAKYAELIARGYEDLRASGELKKILAKYGIVESSSAANK